MDFLNVSKHLSPIVQSDAASNNSNFFFINVRSPTRHHHCAAPATSKQHNTADLEMRRNVQTAMKGLRRREIGGTAGGNEKQNAKRETGASRDTIGHDVRGIRDLS